MILKKHKISFWGNGPYANLVFKNMLEHFVFDFVVCTEKKDHFVKKTALNNNIENFGSIFLKDRKKLKRILNKTDLAILVSFGYIIPKDILMSTKKGFLNIHPSLLPKHRGPAPVVAEILNGDANGGVSVIKMDSKMDHGPILFQIKDKIKEDDSLDHIYRRRFKKASIKLNSILTDYLCKDLPLTKQNHKESTYHKKLNKNDGLINKKDSPIKIIRKFKAYSPWPSIYIFFTNRKGKKEKIILTDLKIRSKIEINKEDLRIKRPFLFNKNHLFFKLDQNNYYIEILKLKIPGKSEINSKSFINGYLK